MGAKRENIWLVDHIGVIFEGRKEEMNPHKAAFAQATEARTLAEVIPNADAFLGLSAGGILSTDMVETMAAMPLILALANPDPEITPDAAKTAFEAAISSVGPQNPGHWIIPSEGGPRMRVRPRTTELAQSASLPTL